MRMQRTCDASNDPEIRKDPLGCAQDACALTPRHDMPRMCGTMSHRYVFETLPGESISFVNHVLA
jgi:hypothetical protein